MRATDIGGWSFRSHGGGLPYPANFVPKLDWMPSTVPGAVHLDLVDNRIIPDPFQQCYEESVQWVDRVPWTYRTSFEWNPSADLPNRTLRFEGLDTVCAVKLNGEEVAQHDNMFLPLEISVTDLLRSGENEIEVEFQPSLLVGQERRESYFKAENLKPDTPNFEDRAFIRKAQYMYGWDWGPRLISCGIWQPVQLLEYRSRIRRASFLQERMASGKFHIRLEAEIEGEAKPTVVFAGIRRGAGENPEFEVPANLWWPNGEGPQTLQEASVALSDGHRIEKRIGLRTIVLHQDEDSRGRSFEFEVNGRRIWARGANWIPNDSFVARDKEIPAQIERCKRLGMNMLRVWGGGFFESERFYDACDRNGILVWQEFPYACSYYPDGSKEQEVAKAEATEHVLRLRDRASLAIWCGNNENLAMYEQSWGGRARQPARYYGEHLYKDAIPAVIAELDQTTPYIGSSPLEPNLPTTGDAHYWDVWHGRGDWKYYKESRSRFASEFGFASSCSMAVWKSEVAPTEELPSHEVVRWHDKTGKTEPVFLGFVKLHYPDPKSLDDWVYYSQLNQRDAFRCGIEHFRCNPDCRGSLIWQFNDCWPVQSWAVQDYRRLLKPAGFELARLYAPILVAINLVEDGAEVHVANDGIVHLKADLSVELFSTLDGSLISREHTAISLAPGDRAICTKQQLEGVDRTSAALRAFVVGDEESQTWQLLAEPKDMKFGTPHVKAEAGHDRISVHVAGFAGDMVVWDDADPETIYDLRSGEPGWKAVTLANASATFGLRKAPVKLMCRSLGGSFKI